jgi:hypothetical protein
MTDTEFLLGVQPQPVDDFVEPPPLSDDMGREDYTEPDADFLKNPRRKRHAVEYENKVKSTLMMGTRFLFDNPNTVPDAATLIMYGPNFSRAMGDWAAEEPWVRKSIDFIAGGANNPGAAAMAALIPMALQILRNHEPVAEVVQPKRIRIPFTKRYISIKFRIKLGKLRNLTNDPKAFTEHVLGNPQIRENLAKQGINLG